jgi:hypothetical protein
MNPDDDVENDDFFQAMDHMARVLHEEDEEGEEK